MDNRPIGFFDSGLGGLTSIPHLKRLLPKEKIIYFGDTARTPYGSKAVSTIRTFATQIADFLVSKDVKNKNPQLFMKKTLVFFIAIIADQVTKIFAKSHLIGSGHGIIAEKISCRRQIGRASCRERV